MRRSGPGGEGRRRSGPGGEGRRRRERGVILTELSQRSPFLMVA